MGSLECLWTPLPKPPTASVLPGLRDRTRGGREMTGPLYERDDTYALLAAEIERAADGAGGTVLRRGATGTGRTAALEAAVSHATAHGLRVLRALLPGGGGAALRHGPASAGPGRGVHPGDPGRRGGRQRDRAVAAGGAAVAAVALVRGEDSATRIRCCGTRCSPSGRRPGGSRCTGRRTGAWARPPRTPWSRPSPPDRPRSCSTRRPRGTAWAAPPRRSGRASSGTSSR